MTRAEHLSRCKERALEYVDRGEFLEGLTSMFSDLGKHLETTAHPAIALGVALMMRGDLSNAEKARRFIEGFN